MSFQNRPGKSMLILLLGCGLLSISMGVGAGLFLGKRAQAGEAHGKKQKSKPKALEVKSVFPVGEIVINLADNDVMRYAKVNVAIGFQEALPEEKLKEEEAILRDTVIGVLTRKTFKELHRSGGMQKVKKEIFTAAAGRIHDATVAEVYFEAYAMQ